MYGLIRNMPGDPLLMKLESASPDRPIRIEDIERMRDDLRPQRPVVHGLLALARERGARRLRRFDSRGPARVIDVISQRIAPTLMLELARRCSLTYMLSIPLGLYATARSGKLDERITSTLLYMLYSLPAFVAALFLQIFFAIKLRGTALSCRCSA